jgi:hypothetical protein
VGRHQWPQRPLRVHHPEGDASGLSGLHIVVKVRDGATPGWKYDTYAHGVATSWHNGPVTQYPITSGNIFVHK